MLLYHVRRRRIEIRLFRRERREARVVSSFAALPCSFLECRDTKGLDENYCIALCIGVSPMLEGSFLVIEYNESQ